MKASGKQAILAIVGVALGVFGASVVPVYDMPFPGCDGSRWITLELGCSHWPEAFRGALFVAPIAIFAPVRWMLPVAAVATIFILALFGGVEGIQTGLHLAVETAGDIYHLFLQAYPSVVGGLAVLLVWLAIAFSHNQGSAPNNGFNRTPESSGPAKPGEPSGGAG